MFGSPFCAMCGEFLKPRQHVLCDGCYEKAKYLCRLRGVLQILDAVWADKYAHPDELTDSVMRLSRAMEKLWNESPFARQGTTWRDL